MAASANSMCSRHSISRMDQPSNPKDPVYHHHRICMPMVSISSDFPRLAWRRMDYRRVKTT